MCVGWARRAEEKVWGIWGEVFQSWKREQNKAKRGRRSTAKSNVTSRDYWKV